MQQIILIAGFLFLSGAGLAQWSQEASNPAVADQVALGLQTLLYGAGIVLLFVSSRQHKKDWAGGLVLSLCCAWVCLSAMWSADPGMTLRRGVVFAAMTAFGAYVGSRVPERLQVKALVGALLCAAVASAAWILVSPDIAMDGTVQNASWRGIFVTKNVLGRAMEM